jgi:hypothetical protein
VRCQPLTRTHTNTHTTHDTTHKQLKIQEKPEKTKSWWEKRKAAKDDKEKTRKLAELELRQKAVADLKSVGADASHLEVSQPYSFPPTSLFCFAVRLPGACGVGSVLTPPAAQQIPSETHFRVHIEKGSMNLLEEEDRLTLALFKYAFGRLFFEVRIADGPTPAVTRPDPTLGWEGVLTMLRCRSRRT